MMAAARALKHKPQRDGQRLRIPKANIPRTAAKTSQRFAGLHNSATGSRLHGGGVLRHGHGLAGAEAGDDPCVLRLHHIGQRFLGGIALAGAVFEVGDFGDEAIFLGTPENVDVIMRRVHSAMRATYATNASSSNGVNKFLLGFTHLDHTIPYGKRAIQQNEPK